MQSITKKLTKAIGDENLEIFRSIVKEIKASSTINKKCLKKIQEYDLKNNDDITTLLIELIDEVKSNRIELPRKQKVWIENVSKEIEVKGLSKEFKQLSKEISSIKTYKDIEMSKEPSWYSVPFVSIAKVLGNIPKQITEKVLRVKIIDTRNPQSPVAVRLSNGKRFYEAMMGVFAGKAGSVPFKNASGEYVEALVDENGRLQVDVVGGGGGSGTGYVGNPIVVGAVAMELTFAGVTQTVAVQSDHDNTGTVWVGPSTVDNFGADAIRRLEAGESFEIDLDDASAPLYVVADGAGQKVYKLALI